MIEFYTRYPEEYNYILHHFMETELSSDGNTAEKLLEVFLPRYLYREQKERCLRTFKELYDWTADDEVHEISVFHELVLYEFIAYLEGSQDETPNFRALYFDERANEMIEKMSKEEFAEYEECEEDDMTLEEYRDTFYDLTFYEDVLFEDTDFLLVETLADREPLSEKALNELLDAGFDDYIDLFPLEIQKKYRQKRQEYS